MLSKAMDSHHLEEAEFSRKCLSQIAAETLVIGIDSDILFHCFRAKFITEHIKT